MVKQVILFDLGGTLVDYMTRLEFPLILKQCITEVQQYLSKEDYSTLHQSQCGRECKKMIKNQ